MALLSTSLIFLRSFPIDADPDPTISLFSLADPDPTFFFEADPDPTFFFDMDLDQTVLFDADPQILCSSSSSSDAHLRLLV